VRKNLEDSPVSLAGDNLVLQAKTAILEDQVRRFHTLQEEGKWREALQQFRATLHCATDVLQDSLSLLQHMTAKEERPSR